MTQQSFNDAIRKLAESGELKHIVVISFKNGKKEIINKVDK